jgi:DNA polymerase-3 subunit gamma/tau
MSYIVTARKWRPTVYEDVIGQEHVTTTLRNAIATNRLSHSYIFSGPRGVGKTTTARILAKAVNCLKPKDFNPDNTCDLCVEITENRSVNVFEIDGASNRGVDEIRNLREAVRYPPAKGKYKVYIIDEVHMLTKEAFNALLKTLEEPPPYIIFIFATTEIHKVPLTILSRCQRFDFRRISIEEIIERLRFIAKKEKITINDDALLILAKRADGSMRDAQSIFDQVVSFCGEKIDVKEIMSVLNVVDDELFFRVTDIIKSKDVKNGLNLVNEIITGGSDIREFLNGLTEHFRNMLVARTTGSTKLIETSEVYKKRYTDESTHFSENDLLRLIKLAGDTESVIRWSQVPRLKLEIAIMQMIKMDSSIQIEQLLKQLEEVKKKLNGNPAGFIAPPMVKNIIEQSEAPSPQHAKTSPSSTLSERAVAVPVKMPVAEPFSGYKKITPLTSPQPSVSTVSLSPDEAARKWSIFVQEACKSKIALGTMLSATHLVDVQDDHLRIGCPDDFHLDALKRNRQFLTDIAHRVYGAKIILDTIISNEKPAASQIETPKAASPASSSSAPTDSLRQHPVVQALMKEFGAIDVEK